MIALSFIMDNDDVRMLWFLVLAFSGCWFPVWRLIVCSIGLV